MMKKHMRCFCCCLAASLVAMPLLSGCIPHPNNGRTSGVTGAGTTAMGTTLSSDYREAEAGTTEAGTTGSLRRSFRSSDSTSKDDLLATRRALRSALPKLQRSMARIQRDVAQLQEDLAQIQSLLNDLESD